MKLRRIVGGLLLLAMLGLVTYAVLARGDPVAPGPPIERLLQRMAWELAFSALTTGLAIAAIAALWPEGRLKRWIEQKAGPTLLVCLIVILLVVGVLVLHLIADG